MPDVPILSSDTVRESTLYSKLGSDKVRCDLCERRCIIAPGHKGRCRTRMNIGGKLFTLVFGDLSAIESRPIELKPFFHYWPGSTALTFSTWSCNFDCPWCQNHHLSKTAPDPSKSAYDSPSSIVDKAMENGDEGLCASFQEPTLLIDWAAQAFKMGSAKGLYCCCVSNGYMTSEALGFLKNSGLDGLKIDVKGDAETYRRYCGGVDVEKVWRNVHEAKRMGIHIEVVNLIVTDVNDDEACVSWLIDRHLKEAGPDTPLHFTRYFPAYKFRKEPTRIDILLHAYKLAREAGVNYPYLGNMPMDGYENTLCPGCGSELIKRSGNVFCHSNLTADKRCPACGLEIPIAGNLVRKRSLG